MITDLHGAVHRIEVWNEMLSQYERQFIWGNCVPGYDESLGQEKPSIIFFKAKNARGEHGCVLIIPGGSYLYKSTNEAVNVARKINSAGIDAAILDYRTAPYPRDIIASDAIRAIRYLRFNAKSMGFCSDKIAVMGFSAGGNLAFLSALFADNGNAEAQDENERVSSRPDALVLCYPAINIVQKYEKTDCFSLISYFDVEISNQKYDLPPTFIWHSMQDELIKCRASMELATMLKDMDVPVELHLFPYGGHGQGLAFDSKGEKNKGENRLTACWSDLCIRWLNYYGFNFKEERYEK